VKIGTLYKNQSI